MRGSLNSCLDAFCQVVMIITGWYFSCTKASAPRVGELVTLDDFLFFLQLVKGKKKKPLQNLKILEYILQFPGLYSASCKCYDIISSPWKKELYNRWWLWDFCYLGANMGFMLSLLLRYFRKWNTEKARSCSELVWGLSILVLQEHGLEMGSLTASAQAAFSSSRMIHWWNEDLEIGLPQKSTENTAGLWTIFHQKSSQNWSSCLSL